MKFPIGSLVCFNKGRRYPNEVFVVLADVRLTYKHYASDPFCWDYDLQPLDLNKTPIGAMESELELYNDDVPTTPILQPGNP